VPNTHAFDDTLVRSLEAPERYPHAVDRVERIETHGNWILLAGECAYKIKKPVEFDFMDFSSLDRRRHFCEEEVRLNRRLAPAIYLRVAAITGSSTHPVIDGDGTPIEYAVVMQRFDPEQRLDRRLERGELQHTDLDALAVDMARFHAGLPAASTDSGYGAPDTLRQQADDNFAACAQHLQGPDADMLQGARTRSDAFFEAHQDHFASRQQDGFVRECHGDLHLGNLTLHADRIQAFDCIEFNPALRWVDTANDIAFLLMDLRYRGHDELAARFRNRYLEWAGDYDAVPLLPFYESYRAMVRAKVALLTADQEDDRERIEQHYDAARRHIALADALLTAGNGRIIVTCGLSGSGKSVVAERLGEVLPAVRLRSDVERKRLFGLDPLSETESEPDAGIYSAQATVQLYDHLAETAARLARHGEVVIIDATFLHTEQRERVREAAAEAGVPFQVVFAHAPQNVLEERIRARAQSGGDASEADVDILHRQQARAQLPNPEDSDVYAVNTTAPVDTEDLAERLLSPFG